MSEHISTNELENWERTGMLSDCAKALLDSRRRVTRMHGAAIAAVREARPHTLASENADIYRAYENGARSVLDAIEVAMNREEATT